MKWSEEYNKSWLEGRRLVVGAAALGQLSAELLASSLGLRRVGTTCGAGLAPIVGNGGGGTGGHLVAPCELYADLNCDICVLLVRSPLAVHRASQFLEKVVQLAIEHKSSEVIILTSSEASEKHSVQSVPFRYVSNSHVQNPQRFEQLQWVNYNADGEDKIIYQGGFARKLFHMCTEAHLPCLILFKYYYEGDNIPDAVETVSYLNQWLDAFKITENEDIRNKIVFPISWRFPFGNRPPKSIY